MNSRIAFGLRYCVAMAFLLVACGCHDSLADAGTPDQTVADVVPTAISPPAAAGPVAGALNISDSDEPRKVEILIKERNFHPEKPHQSLRVSFDDLDLLKVINMKPVTKDCIEKMPQWLRDLDGKQIVIRGFMKPLEYMTDIESFLFVRDSSLCCFGSNPLIHDMIYVKLNPEELTNYIELRPFDVSGTFRIELLEDSDRLLGLYFLDNARVLTR